MAADRETRVPDNGGVDLINDPAAQEMLSGEAHYVEEGDPLIDALNASHAVLRYFGGTVQIAAVRVPIAPDVSPEAHISVEYVVRWNPYDLKRPMADMPQGEAVDRARELSEEEQELHAVQESAA